MKFYLIVLLMALSLVSAAHAADAPAEQTAADKPAAATETEIQIERTGNPMELVQKGMALMKQGDLNTAEVMFSNALELARQINDTKSLTFAALLLDKVYSTQGVKDKAVDNLIILTAALEGAGQDDKLAALYLKLGNLFFETGKYRESVKALDSAKTLFESTGNSSKNAYIENSKAMAWSALGEFAEAEKIYGALLTDSMAEGNATNTISILANLGDLYRTKSDYGVALEKYESALKLAEDNNKPAEQVLMLNNIALVHQFRADLDQAKAAVDKAIAIAEANNDKRGLAACYHQRGILLVHAGDASAAIESYKKSVELKTDIHDASIGNTLAEIGRAYYFRGNYKPARQYYRDSLKTGFPIDIEITVNNNLAMVFKMQGMLDYALEIFNESLEKARAYNLRYQKSFLLNNIGVVQREMGELDEALKNHEEARAIDAEVGAKLDELVDVNNIALVYKLKGEYDKALELLLGVKDTARALGSYDDFVRTLVNLADVYLLMEKYDDALAHYQEAADTAEKIMSRERLWNALFGMGQTYMKKGDTGKAIDALKRAVEVIETLRADIGDGGDEKSFFLVDKVKVYTHLIIMLYQKGEYGEALDYLERMKSRSLLDLIQKGRANIDKGLDDEEVAREKELKINLAKTTREMAKAMADNGPDSAQARIAKVNLERVRAESNAFNEMIYTKHPKLAFARGENKPVTHSQLQAFLADDEIIVAYMLGEETSYAWTVTSDAIKMYDLGETGEKIGFTIDKKLREALEKGVWGSSQERAANKLYKQVIEPFEADLEGKNIMGVLPDGRLYEIPFYLLIDNNDKFLIDKLAIFYIPSISVMVENRKTVSTLVNENKILAFGNPKFERKDLVQLPGTEAEVEKIAEIFGTNSSTHFHEDALEEHIKFFGRNYKIVHMATHGLLNNQNPLFSSIALSQIREQNDDGYLEAREISNVELDAELVVMSACESGRGKLRPGEGILGLTRSFFSSGVPSVIASMWQVNDLATSFMMQDFYRNMGKMGSVEALRQAQIATRDQIDANPNRWAPFIIMGFGINHMPDKAE